jgi:hypothetical protein
MIPVFRKGISLTLASAAASSMLIGITAPLAICRSGSGRSRTDSHLQPGASL